MNGDRAVTVRLDDNLRDAARALLTRWDDVCTFDPASPGYAELWTHEDAQAIDALMERLRAVLAARAPGDASPTEPTPRMVDFYGHVHERLTTEPPPGRPS